MANDDETDCLSPTLYTTLVAESTIGIHLIYYTCFGTLHTSGKGVEICRMIFFSEVGHLTVKEQGKGQENRKQ